MMLVLQCRIHSSSKAIAKLIKLSEIYNVFIYDLKKASINVHIDMAVTGDNKCT